MCRLERALDHQASAIAVNRDALRVRVGGQHGQLVVGVAARGQDGQRLAKGNTGQGQGQGTRVRNDGVGVRLTAAEGWPWRVSYKGTGGRKGKGKGNDT